MSYALPKWTDGNFSSGNPSSLPVFEAPIPGVAAEYVFTQRWRQFRNNLDSSGPTALNTAHPTYSSFKLVEEGPRQEVDGGIVETVRKYAALPATHYDYDIFGYSLIGLLTQVATGAGPAYTSVSRSREVKPLRSRVQYDYFLVPTSGSTTVTDPITGTSVVISTAGDILNIQEMVYCYQNTIYASGGSGTAIAGGITMKVDILNPAGSLLKTWPTSDDYNNVMVQDAISNGWSGTVTKIVLFPTTTYTGGPPPTAGHNAGAIDLTSTPHSVLGGIMPVGASVLTRWLGNYYQRATRYVLAQ